MPCDFLLPCYLWFFTALLFVILYCSVLLYCPVVLWLCMTFSCVSVSVPHLWAHRITSTFYCPPSRLTPAVKVEKIHLKMDYTSFSSSSSFKLGHVPASSSSSSSCSTVSSSPSKPGLNSQSVPKAHQPSPGHIPNGKGHLSPLSKKQDSSTNASSKRPTRKVLGKSGFSRMPFFR